MKKTAKIALIMGLAAICMLTGCAGKGKVKQIYSATLPTEALPADIYVEPIEGITDDFFRGVDISSIISEEESGVVYYNEAGEPTDIFRILADAGVNYVRVRVWNDPYDANGNGYGGGNCDAAKAALIGRRAAEYGMKLMVDFHYSDFWSDPSKQMCPKAWVGMTSDEKAEAAYAFTVDAMETILASGSDVGIVQLGNENNKAMSGESLWADISKIIARGRDAVLEKADAYDKDVKIALHFTNPEDVDGMYALLRKLNNFEVQYDIIGLSYYPYWHGTLENLESLMKEIKTRTGKDVMVSETSYMYTLDDGDGHGNSCGTKDLNKNYAPTVQSQANEYRDVCESVVKAGGLGVFYWEPAWIPVHDYNYEAADAASVLASNKQAWEQFGSGWASSYATEYDPSDAGVYYGGSAWDNQALFDHTGHPLASLNIFKYLKYGTICDAKVDFVNDVLVEVNPGGTLKMPETVAANFNNRSLNGPASVTWNETELAKVDVNKVGEYAVSGSFADGTKVNATVKVAKLNFVKNASFEDSDRSMWKFIYEGADVLDFQKKESDAVTGEWTMHYWREGEVEFKAEQSFTGLDDGKYYFSMNAQGGDSGSSPEMYIYAVSGGVTYTQPYAVNGWCNWVSPEIASFDVVGGEVTIGVYVKAGKGAWGTFDDFYMCKLD